MSSQSSRSDTRLLMLLCRLASSSRQAPFLSPSSWSDAGLHPWLGKRYFTPLSPLSIIPDNTQAAESISIRSLQTCTAILVESEGQDKAIDVRLLQYGDVFKVVPDTQIPTDGTVIAGSSEVDEAMLTGESVPVVKLAGSSVIAGSLNGPGTLTIRLTRLPGDNTITTIASMVDEAKLSKPRIQDIADRVASFFVPVVVGLTIVTFIIWVAIGLAVRKQSGSDAVIEAVTYAITVLIVSCPCAIGLAVPMVIVIATGVAARHGVIFKTAASIEVAYKTTDIILDKTGTLTLGRPQVVEEVSVSPNPSTFESLLLGLLADIKHPISAAITSHLSEKETTRLPVQGRKVITGNGVEGLWQGQLLRAGNARWLSLDAHPLVRSLLSKGLTVTCFTIDGDAVAVYGLQDTLRPETSSVILELQRRNIAVHVLSGDDDGAVQSIARQLLICGDHVRSRCSPADKRAYVEALQAGPVSPQASRKKARKPIVMFIGDGTNDAVALAQSTIGVHMSSGTDIAQSAADVVLIRSDLSGILTLLTISKRAMHRVTFNFGWSFFYNLFAVLLGAGAFVNARIPPEFAGLGELVSVLPVIAAAVLLRWPKV
jgi:heavy metal translocating P-type ATPase